MAEKPLALPPFGRRAAIRKSRLYIVAIAFGVVVPLGAATVALVLLFFEAR